MRDARSGGPPGERERDREGRDVLMRDSFRGERGLERSDSLREKRDREMRERELMRMERDRDRMERDRMERGDRGDREREMRERDRLFLERGPPGMERDPRGLEPPAVLGARERDREREGLRDSREVKKVKTEQPPTPGGVGASSPGKDKDGRKGGGK